MAGSAALMAQAPQPTPVSGNPEEELTAARNRNKQYAAEMAKQEVPMSTPPAFRFQA
jgi:hypothetical protein